MLVVYLSPTEYEGASPENMFHFGFTFLAHGLCTWAQIAKHTRAIASAVLVYPTIIWN